MGDLIDAATREAVWEDKRIYGVAPAEVVSNLDLTGLGRVQLRLPWLPGYSPWARVAAFSAGSGRGGYFIPQNGDEVLVAFSHGDVRVLRLQRRRECEARKIDDVHGPAETAQAPDLRGERAPVGRKPRDDERMRWSSAAPACHPEAVPVARRDMHLHGHHLCNGRAGRACRWAAAGRALETLPPTPMKRQRFRNPAGRRARSARSPFA